MTKRAVIAAALTFITALSFMPAPAEADVWFTPHLGVTLGGNANFGKIFVSKVHFVKQRSIGGALGWIDDDGRFGFEADLGLTENLFRNTSGYSDFQFGDSKVTAVMANVVVREPVAGSSSRRIRPYASGGLGLLQTNVKASPSMHQGLNQYDLGINLGGGAHVFSNNIVGLRCDLRYFRSLRDGELGGVRHIAGDLTFWRATIGITFFGG